MNSRTAWLIVGGIVIVCLCIIVIGVLVLYGTGRIVLRAATEIGPMIEEAATAGTIPINPIPLGPTSTVVPEQAATPTQVPIQSENIDPQTAAEMDEIERQVAQLRGLSPTGPVARTLLTPADLRQHVIDDFLSDYTADEARDDARVLSLLGLLDVNFDLEGFYIELYSEQIAGYYDDELKQMFVVQGDGFNGIERLTYAHEYDHTLQDQVFGFSEEGLNYTDESCQLDTERCAGIQALIEGDATVLEEDWLTTYATAQDYNDILEFYDSFQSPVYDSAPGFMRQDFIFPYTYGADFVREVKRQGGWSAVNAVYSDPPVSTEQILHPDHYPWDTPVIVTPPEALDALGTGWREIERNTVGEWYTQLVLSEYLDTDRATLAAQGWGGDTYVAYSNDSANTRAIVLIMVWDNASEATEYAQAFAEYGDARFGEGTQTQSGRSWDSTNAASLFEMSGTQTLWILAPSADLRQTLRSAVEFPSTN